MPVQVSVNIDTFLRSVDNAAARTNLGLGALATVTPGTGVATALAVNIGSAGAVITNGGTTTTLGFVGATSGTATLQAPAVAGTPTITLPGVTSTLATLGANTLTGAQVLSVNGAASTPPLSLTGTLFTSGTTTTAKASLLIEPAGTTSTGWTASGTAFGINLPSPFAGRAIDVQKQGVTYCSIGHDGTITTIGTVVANGGGLYMRNGGTDLFNVQSSTSALCVAPTYSMGFSSASGFGMTPDAFFRRASAAASIQMGADSATPIAQCFKGPNGSGTNIVGGKLSIAAGQSTGSGTPAVLALQSTAAGSSGTTAQTLVDVLTVTNSTLVTVADSVNFALNTSNGTQFGLAADQKLSFHGATPTAQYTPATSGGLASAGSNEPIFGDTTFNGNTGSSAYTIADLVAALKVKGIIAS